MTQVAKLQVTTPEDHELRSPAPSTRRAPRLRRLDQARAGQRWLLGPSGWTMPVCEIDLRVGGALSLCLAKRRRARHGHGRGFREIVAPGRLVHTELFDEDWTGGETVATVLEEASGRTTMTQTVLYSSREARDGAMRSGMEQGMATSYDRLDTILAEAKAASKAG